MLLLNKSMMRFFKHPTHRSDLAGLADTYVYMYRGPWLSVAEKQAIDAIPNTTGYHNVASIRSIIAVGRTELQSQYLGVIKKAHGQGYDESVFRLSESSNVFSPTAGSVDLLLLTIFGSSFSNGRISVLLNVGTIGSGADIEMETNVFAAGERFKLNDAIVSIQNLLGEM